MTTAFVIVFILWSIVLFFCLYYIRKVFTGLQCSDNVNVNRSNNTNSNTLYSTSFNNPVYEELNEDEYDSMRIRIRRNSISRHGVRTLEPETIGTAY